MIKAGMEQQGFVSWYIIHMHIYRWMFTYKFCFHDDTCRNQIKLQTSSLIKISTKN